MDWHSIFATAFLVMFWVGLLLTVVTAVFSGVFESEFGSGSAIEGGVATDLGGPPIEAADFSPGTAHVGWSDMDVVGISPFSPPVICAFLAGAGGIGHLALTRWDLGVPGAAFVSAAAGLVVGGIAFFSIAWVMRRVQASSHTHEDALVGRTASVSTGIEPGHVGAIVLEAGGTRVTVPARCLDASAVPERAEVLVKGREGAVYVVEETRESWLRRSRSAAGEQRWS